MTRILGSLYFRKGQQGDDRVDRKSSFLYLDSLDNDEEEEKAEGGGRRE